MAGATIAETTTSAQRASGKACPAKNLSKRMAFVSLLSNIVSFRSVKLQNDSAGNGTGGQHPRSRSVLGACPYSKICPVRVTTHGTPRSGDTEICDATPGICTHDVPFCNWKIFAPALVTSPQPVIQTSPYGPASGAVTGPTAILLAQPAGAPVK